MFQPRRQGELSIVSPTVVISTVLPVARPGLTTWKVTPSSSSSRSNGPLATASPARAGTAAAQSATSNASPRNGPAPRRTTLPTSKTFATIHPP